MELSGKLASRAAMLIMYATDVGNARSPKSRYKALVKLRKFMDDQDPMDLHLSLLQEIQVAEEQLD